MLSQYVDPSEQKTRGEADEDEFNLNAFNGVKQLDSAFVFKRRRDGQQKLCIITVRCVLMLCLGFALFRSSSQSIMYNLRLNVVRHPPIDKYTYFCT